MGGISLLTQEIVWVKVATARQTTQGLDIQRGERPPKGPATWRSTSSLFGDGEGKAGPRKEEDISASPQLTADPCPSNTRSSFLSGPGGSVARREQREGGKAGGCSRGICAALTAPPPGQLVAQPSPEKSGMQAGKEEACGHCISPSLLRTTHPGMCLSPRLANGVGMGEGTVAWSWLRLSKV